MSASMHPSDSGRLPDGTAAIVLLDARGTVLTCTGEVEELTGLRAEELRGYRMADLLAGGSGEAPGSAGMPPGGNVTLRGPDGEPAEVRLTVLPLSPGSDCRALVMLTPASAARLREEDQALVRALFSQTRFRLAIHDTELRMIRVNMIPSLELPPGTSYAQVRPGARVGDFMVPEDAARLEEQLRRVAETGEPLVDWEQSARLVTTRERERRVAYSAFRLHKEEGGVMGVAVFAADVTDQFLNRRRLELLHAASTRLGRTLDVIANTEELARVLVPDLADLASVDLTAEVVAGEEPGAFFGADSELRRVATAAFDGRWPPEVYSVGETFRIQDVERETLSTDSAAVVADLTWVRGQFAQYPGRSRLALPHAATSLMIVPVRARGLVLGAVGLWRVGERPSFGPDDTVLAEEIVSRAALSVDNARRYAREHRTVETLQRSLLPQPVVDLSAAETAGTYVPAATAAGTGGSWFDVIPLSSCRVAFVVGDMAAHGLTATAAMGRLRTAVLTLADLDLAPEELLTRLDDLAGRLADAEPRNDPGTGSGVLGATCLYCVYDPVSGRCTMASAGRPSPIVLAARRAADFAPLKPGPPLGVGGLPFESAEVPLDPGSLLVFGTDEAMAHAGESPERGMIRLRDQAAAVARDDRTPAEIGRMVLEDLLPGEPPANEVALLVARVRAMPAGTVATWEFPADPAVVARTRSLVTSQLAEWDLPQLAFTTELIASELVTNSIRHAGGPVVLRLIRDETLICEVSDPSQTQPHLRRAQPTDEGGRGLFLIAQLTHRWGSRYTHSGKTIWTEQLLEAEPEAF
ncbi:SpoIIE family protein phosphatase [Streptomyces sp. ACA25]|uniref:ATP-binding SpoIIE family protein phosphatase n=1 Tax=Streptomyces sp. ACA25 TaxID=3022596 RepID=UPI0023083358|nr:SpoIIE family protein phosphatase [Streptomyces sp. ACA25]MDB1089363.1 SpoIIE family protein phosphatase [Streptomyces sp. ACA25]